MKYLLALTLFVSSLACFAAVYMQTDSNGNVVYSDTPEEHGKPITLPADNSISLPQNTAAPAKNTSLSTSAAGTAVVGQPTNGKSYTTFIMIDPIDQETFQNQPIIPVTVQVEPSLHEGDSVELFVDGAPSGKPTADLTQLALRQVERGEHQLSAAILDATGHSLQKTNSITIYIHYSALVTGSGGIAPVSSGGGAAPSSPGSGIAPPSQYGTGITPPASSGNGTTPPTTAGSGTVPPASGGSGVTPPAQYGSGIVPGR